MMSSGPLVSTRARVTGGGGMPIGTVHMCNPPGRKMRWTSAKASIGLRICSNMSDVMTTSKLSSAKEVAIRS